MLNGAKVTKELLNALDNTKKPKTNADRIRAMSDEELISFFVLEDKCPKNISSRECDGFESCKDCWVHWLKQPAEEVHADG